MTGGKASNISDLIQKVASSCIITPLPCRNPGDASDGDLTDQEEYDGRAYSICYGSANGKSTRMAGDQEGEEEEGEERFRLWEEEEKRDGAAERAKAAEGMMAEVFEAVSVVKRAYVKLQEAHCPWDPERMRAADAAVVAELRRLGRLKERWWFRRGGGGEGVGRAAAAVEPYEAAVEELKRELRAKEAEVEGLKERLRRGSDDGDGGGRRRSSGHRVARRKGSQGK